ncbi:dual specificity protein phosphatase 22 isoform X2 [Protopterus annectens]|uniref:dual specificity protein phosphatase 22 isoform X2 n=1 Tax=Protopterus annectens TaxID=7888 RepID=UPI001CFA743D|nr:dual specificity protein phosphatase 22 isoform X2 [Protopterus annectens]
MGNGMNKILPGLYIGNIKDARDREQLGKNNITHILSVHDSARPVLEDMKYLCIPAVDSPSQNLLAGVSRSVTVTVAYVMTITDFGWEDSLSAIKVARSCANPNFGFQKQLQEFETGDVLKLRQWLKEMYGESSSEDKEEILNLLIKFREQQAAEELNRPHCDASYSSTSTLSSASHSYTARTPL